MPGILLYGYNKDAVEKIRHAFEPFINGGPVVISASLCGEQTVSDALSPGFMQRFADHAGKFIMFVDFDTHHIERALAAFPESEGIERPVFCGLTENNFEWPLGKLSAHLYEEKARFEKP